MLSQEQKSKRFKEFTGSNTEYFNVVEAKTDKNAANKAKREASSKIDKKPTKTDDADEELEEEP